MKYLRINLTKDVADLHTKNHWALLRDREDLRKQRDVYCSWVERFNIVICHIFSKLRKFLQIQCDPSLNPSKVFFFFLEIDKFILKIYVEIQRTYSN